MIPLTEQLAFVKQELASRHSAYLNAVRTGVTVRTSTKRDLDILADIVETLDKLIGLEEVSRTMRGDVELSEFESFHYQAAEELRTGQRKINPEELFL